MTKRWYSHFVIALTWCLGISISAQTWAADAVNGGKLYNTYCISCHGDLRDDAGFFNIQRAANNPSLISTQILVNPQMQQFIGKFTQSQLADIAAYIANPQASLQVVPASGFWWNPAEGGRGFVIEQQGNNLFFASFLYDPSGRATWYAGNSAPINNAFFASRLTTYLGGQSLTGTYHPPTGTMDAGAISITFSDATHGVMTWPGGTIAIQRFDIVPGGSGLTPPAGTPETGVWWNADEGGRGYVIEIQNNVIFIGGFMYDNAGNPIWYVSSGPMQMTDSNTYQGIWQQYGNGQTLTSAYKPASVVNSNVGSISIHFSSTTTATLTLPDGRQISLSRFKF